MRVHFIAIGGAIMHNLAIALKQRGYDVSGSDDVIFDPSRSLLEKYGLLPASFGFFPDKIDRSIDVVILGMHAKIDNPELAKAMELGLKVYSFPEFIYEQSKDKIRVVVAGSHGKTTITSMIMHVLKHTNRDFDYLCGSSVAGFENNVKLSDAPIIILEGDEYLTSALENEPKFLYYKGNYALLSGIEWDHINVFPTLELYHLQFQKLIDSLMPEASLVYFEEDADIRSLVENNRADIHYIPYQTPSYKVDGEQTFLINNEQTYPLSVFGKHNMQNIEGARKICNLLQISDEAFYKAITSFSGAGRRLEVIRKDTETILFKDFAHSPSKLKATVQSAKEQFPHRQVIACMELHTFSSLKKEFLPQYAHALDKADYPVIFLNEATIKQKGNETFTEQEIRDAFQNQHIKLFTEKTSLENYLYSFPRSQKVFLMMSSGNFGGIDLNDLSFKIFNDYRLEKSRIEAEMPTVSASQKTVDQKLVEENIPEEYASQLRWLHISGLLTTFILPLYFYNTPVEIIQREAKKVINYQASLWVILILLWYLGKFLCGITYPVIAILLFLDVMYAITNTIHANNHQPSRYPKYFNIL